jgi:hypothetical protein
VDTVRLARIARSHADAIEEAERAGRPIPPIDYPTA